MTSQQIRAVAFDIDGTLYPNSTMYRASVPFLIRHFRLVRAFAAARREVRTVRPVVDLHRTQAELVARRLKMSADEAHDLIQRTIYTEWETVIRKVKPFPEVRTVIERLRSSGYRVAAMSDFPVERKLELLGLADIWDVAFSSEEIHYLKPNAEPFIELANRLDCSPETILYVGNSYHYDVRGAAAVGMRTAHLARRPVGPPTADLTFWHFPTLERWLFNQND